VRWLRVAWLGSLCSIYERCASAFSGSAWSNKTSRVLDLVAASPSRRHPCWSMSALSTHLISAYIGLIDPFALPSFASFSQTARTPLTLAISGLMSYNAAMHGNFNANPSFSNSHSHPQHLSVAVTIQIHLNRQQSVRMLTCRCIQLSHPTSQTR